MIGASHPVFRALMSLWCHLFFTLQITTDARQRARPGMKINKNTAQKPNYFTDNSNIL